MGAFDGGGGGLSHTRVVVMTITMSQMLNLIYLLRFRKLNIALNTVLFHSSKPNTLKTTNKLRKVVYQEVSQ